MKLTRSGLKDLIKECLMEVLAEGLGAGIAASMQESAPARQPRRNTKKTSPRRKSALDMIKFDTKVNEVASSMTSDPTMAAIFADTAKTTLQEQRAAGNNRAQVHSAPSAPLDAAARAADNLDPNQMEGSNNWAHLAFFDEQ